MFLFLFLWKGPVFSLAIHFIHTQRKKNMAATQKWVSEPDLQWNECERIWTAESTHGTHDERQHHLKWNKHTHTHTCTCTNEWTNCLRKRKRGKERGYIAHAHELHTPREKQTWVSVCMSSSYRMHAMYNAAHGCACVYSFVCLYGRAKWAKQIRRETGWCCCDRKMTLWIFGLPLMRVYCVSVCLQSLKLRAVHVWVLHWREN